MVWSVGGRCCGYSGSRCPRRAVPVALGECVVLYGISMVIIAWWKKKKKKKKKKKNGCC